MQKPVQIPIHLDGEGGWEIDNKWWSTNTIRKSIIGLEEFELPLMGIDMSTLPWHLPNFTWILYHIKRIQKANLKHPIVLDPNGQIIDGWHRIAKAVLLGRESIKAVRLNVMPEVDEFKSES